MSNESKSSKVFNFKHEFWTNGKRHFKTLNIKKKEIDFRKPESNWNLIDIKVKEKKTIIDEEHNRHPDRLDEGFKYATHCQHIHIIKCANALRDELGKCIELSEKNKTFAAKKRKSNPSRKMSLQLKTSTNTSVNSDDISSESLVDTLVKPMISMTVDKGDKHQHVSKSADRNNTNIFGLNKDFNDSFVDNSLVTDSQKALIFTPNSSPASSNRSNAAGTARWCSGLYKLTREEIEEYKEIAANEPFLSSESDYSVDRRENNNNVQSILIESNVASNVESPSDNGDSCIDGSVSAASGTAEEHNQCVSDRIKSGETAKTNEMIFNSEFVSVEPVPETVKKTLDNMIYTLTGEQNKSSTPFSPGIGNESQNIDEPETTMKRRDEDKADDSGDEIFLNFYKNYETDDSFEINDVQHHNGSEIYRIAGTFDTGDDENILKKTFVDTNRGVTIIGNNIEYTINKVKPVVDIDNSDVSIDEPNQCKETMRETAESDTSFKGENTTNSVIITDAITGKDDDDDDDDDDDGGGDDDDDDQPIHYTFDEDADGGQQLISDDNVVDINNNNSITTFDDTSIEKADKMSEETVTETVSEMNTDIRTENNNKRMISAYCCRRSTRLKSRPPPLPSPTTNTTHKEIKCSVRSIDQGSDNDGESESERKTTKKRKTTKQRDATKKGKTTEKINTTKKRNVTKKRNETIASREQSLVERIPPDFWPKSERKIVILSTEDEEKHYMTYKQFYKRLDEEIVEQIRDKKDDNYLGFRLRTEIKESAQLIDQTPTRTQSQMVVLLGRPTAFLTPPPKPTRGRKFTNEGKGFVQWVCPICETNNESDQLAQLVVSRFARIDNFTSHFSEKHDNVLQRELKVFNEEKLKLNAPQKRRTNSNGCGEMRSETVTKTSKNKSQPKKRSKREFRQRNSKKAKLNSDYDDQSQDMDTDKYNDRIGKSEKTSHRIASKRAKNSN